MKISIKKNLVSGIFAMVFGIVMLLTIPIYIKSKIVTSTQAVGPDYLPKIMAWIMLICGALLVGKSVILKKDSKVVLELKGEGRVLFYIGLMIAYVILMKYIGFLFSSILAIIGIFIIMKDKKWSHYAIGVALTVAVWAIFKFLLNVPLP